MGDNQMNNTWRCDKHRSGGNDGSGCWWCEQDSTLENLAKMCGKEYGFKLNFSAEVEGDNNNWDISIFDMDGFVYETSWHDSVEKCVKEAMEFLKSEANES